MIVAFRLWTTVSIAWPVGGVPALFVLRTGLAITLCSVTLTIVAFLCTVTCVEFGSMGGRASGGEEESLEREEWLQASEPGKLDDLLTFLEEMVMEEKPALF